MNFVTDLHKKKKKRFKKPSSLTDSKSIWLTYFSPKTYHYVLTTIINVIKMVFVA